MVIFSNKIITIMTITLLFLTGCSSSNKEPTLKTRFIHLEKVMVETYIGSFDTGDEIIYIDSIEINNGKIVEYSFEGSIIHFTISGGDENVFDEKTDKTVEPSRKVAELRESCAKYECPPWSTLSGAMCRVANPLPIPEWRAGDGFFTQQLRCPARYTMQGNQCIWNGDFSATCVSLGITNSCPSGYALVGANCYNCTRGELRNNMCHYTEHVNYTYFKYRITVNYYR